MGGRRCEPGCTCGRHGSQIGLVHRDPVTRFWLKVDKRGPDECWEWTGVQTQKGYGFLYAGSSRPEKRGVLAHRLSWEIAHGYAPPADRLICHHCDNRLCVNPAHLYLGTYQSNAQDRADRKRGWETRPWTDEKRVQNHNLRKTHCPQGHEYTPENTILKRSRRHCRACNREQSLRYYYSKHPRTAP